jgi:hypothetical protein
MPVRYISRITEELKGVGLPIYHGSILLWQALRVSHLIGHDRDKLARPLDDAQSMQDSFDIAGI